MQSWRRSACAAGAFVILLTRVAGATPIDFAAIPRPAAAVREAASQYPLYPQSARWGALRWTPAGYSPDLYAHSVSALETLRDSRSLAVRATDLLVMWSGVRGAGAAVWGYNTYLPTPSATGDFLRRSLTVATWQAVYDTPSSGVAARRSMQFLVPLYELPVDGPATWVGASSVAVRAAFAVAGLAMLAGLRRIRPPAPHPATTHPVTRCPGSRSATPPDPAG